MHGLMAEDIERLAQIAESKRMYWAIESGLGWSASACLIVTSSVPQEGKTTMAAILAAVAARQSRKRVLLADLDWYTPALHRLFSLDLTFSTDALDGSNSIMDFVQPSGLSGLDILGAAKKTQESSEPGADMSRIGIRIIAEARDAYDFIVLDTCSVLRMNRYMMDPVNIAAAADGVALVVMANETHRAQVKRSHILLETAGANVLGLIVNQWKNPLA